MHESRGLGDVYKRQVQVFNDRNGRLGTDTFYQALAATRHDNIDILLHAHQLTDRGG